MQKNRDAHYYLLLFCKLTTSVQYAVIFLFVLLNKVTHDLCVLSLPSLPLPPPPSPTTTAYILCNNILR